MLEGIAIALALPQPHAAGAARGRIEAFEPIYEKEVFSNIAFQLRK